MGVIDALVVMLALLPAGWGQINNRPPEKTVFYLDSNADCNGPVREIYTQTVSVEGHGASQEQLGPTSCTLTLKSTSNFDHSNMLLEVIAANINDCNVQLVFYDGDPGQGTLKGFDCHSASKPNERNFVTSGNVVSFVLERKNVINTAYDIEIRVTPLVTGSQPGYENDYGDTWGYFREKLENDYAVVIVGCSFILVIGLVILGVILCYRRYLGKNKPWQTHQLSTFRPAQSIYETKSKISDTSSDVWTSNMSRTRMDPPRRPNYRMDHPSEDGDSVFDDDVAPKKYLVDEERRWERERDRRDRERDRPRGRGRDAGSQNSSYVQADDDHPQDNYVERSIEPRGRHRRYHKPPSYNEAINESETERSDFDDDEDEEEESDDDMHKNETSEEESEEEEMEEEEEEEEEEEDGSGAAAAAPRPMPRGRQQQQASGPVPVPPGMPPGAMYPGYPPPMGYYPMGPGQFVPVMAGHPPPPGQPFPAAGPPGHPPPRYPGQAAAGVQPTDPPIYSYLVQRGYTPLDSRSQDRGGGSSSHNTSHSQASGLDEPDRTNLASGVDYLSR